MRRSRPSNRTLQSVPGGPRGRVGSEGDTVVQAEEAAVVDPHYGRRARRRPVDNVIDVEVSVRGVCERVRDGQIVVDEKSHTAVEGEKDDVSVRGRFILLKIPQP